MLTFTENTKYDINMLLASMELRTLKVLCISFPALLLITMEGHEPILMEDHCLLSPITMLCLTLVANVAVQQKQVRDMPMNLPQESFS